MKEPTVSNPSRIVRPDAEQIPQELAELAAAISSLPAEHRGAVEAPFARVLEAVKRRRRILSLVQEALGQLRLDMKYLAFDLEATRRERDHYRRQLEGKG